MSEGEYRAFLAAAMKHVKTFSSDGSIHYFSRAAHRP